MKAEVIWTLFDDDIVKEKLEIMNTLETMWDDERNQIQIGRAHV